MPGPGAYAAPNWANSQRVGDVGTKATLMLLAAYADEHFSCYPGQERIADETEQSVRTVRRQLDLLEELGLIGREPRYVFSETSGKRVRTSDRFVLHLDVTVAKADVLAAQSRIAAGQGTRKAARSKGADTAEDLADKMAGRSADDLPADLAGRSERDVPANLAGTSEPGPTGQNRPTYRPKSTSTPVTSGRVTPRETPRRTPRTTSTSRDVAAAVDNSGIATAPAATAAANDVDLAAQPMGKLKLPIDNDEVERTLAYLPDRLRPTLSEAFRMRKLIVQRMQRGWTREAILQAVEQRLHPGGSLDNPCGLFAKVLVPLDESPTLTTQPEQPRQHLTVAKPWCGQCDEKTRRPLDDCGYPDNTLPRNSCLECQHLDFEQHMERGAS